MINHHDRLFSVWHNHHDQLYEWSWSALSIICSATRPSRHGFLEGDLFKTEGSQKEAESIEHDDHYDDGGEAMVMMMMMLMMMIYI